MENEPTSTKIHDTLNEILDEGTTQQTLDDGTLIQNIDIEKLDRLAEKKLRKEKRKKKGLFTKAIFR